MKMIVIAMLVLMLLQYKTTKPTNYSHLTEIEKINQLRRMNEYPPSFYRLANMIEARPEAVIYFKLERNFLDIFDLPLLFTKYINPIFFPIFLLGLFEAVRTRPRMVLAFCLPPVLLLTLIGHENTKGPFSLLVIIYGCAAFGLVRLVGVIRSGYEK